MHMPPIQTFGQIKRWNCCFQGDLSILGDVCGHVRWVEDRNRLWKKLKHHMQKKSKIIIIINVIVIKLKKNCKFKII